MPKKMQFNVIELELEIPDVEVLGTERGQKGEYIIRVKSTIEGTKCHKCGRKITNYHGKDRVVRVRHLPLQGHACYIEVEPQRYSCPRCSSEDGKRKVTTTQRLEWFNNKNSLTISYEDYLLVELVNSTVQDVSVKEEIGYDIVLGVLNRRIEAEVDWSEIEEIGILGIDEIALRKGHKDFVVIVTSKQATGEIILLGVLENRCKATVKAFFSKIPFHLRTTIDTMCTDMWSAYINSAREVFEYDSVIPVSDAENRVPVKKAAIVVDRFHVAKKYRDCLDELRKVVMKRLKGELSEEEYQEFKGIHWLLRRHPDDLEPDDIALLDKLFELSSELKIAYDFCVELTQIFDTHQDRAAGEKQLNGWIKRVEESKLTCFDSFITTLKKHFQEIVNYFQRRLSSGFVEGLNNRIKVIKRRCYGILQPTSLFRRISLDLSGYRRFKPRYS